MRRIYLVPILVSFLLAGCDSLRFAPGEAQKQNAWFHNRTAVITAQAAQIEDASEQLKALMQLSEFQSRAFVSYYGLPKQFPKAENAEDILAESSRQLARTALAQSAERPDGWQVADNALELAIGVFALLGGVYGARAVRLLKQTKAKSQALREIIVGNELFKKQHVESAPAFKAAHKDQTPTTRQIVAQLKR